jgi:hypothetical protein
VFKLLRILPEPAQYAAARPPHDGVKPSWRLPAQTLLLKCVDQLLRLDVEHLLGQNGDHEWAPWRTKLLGD